MDRPREVNIWTLLNARTDLSSPRTPPATPYVCGTTTSEGTAPDILDAGTIRELMPYSSPLPPRLSSFVFLPPIISSESSCTTTRTTDGKEINADLIVRP